MWLKGVFFLLDKIRALFFNGAANQMISNVILGFLRERLVSHKKILTKGGVRIGQS
jgi:hypothetical protein